MANAAIVTLTNAVPVAVLFGPQKVSTPNAVYTANAASVTSAGRPTLQLGLDIATKRRKTNHVNISLSLPREHTVDEIVKVNDIGWFKGQFILPEEWSDLDRDNLLAMVKDLIAEAVMSELVKDLEPVY